MTQKKPCRSFYQIGAEMRWWVRFCALPFAVRALERLQAHVCSPVDGKCPGNCESLSTAREVARIWFYGRRLRSEAG